MVAYQTTSIEVGVWIYIAFKIDTSLKLNIPENLRKKHLVLVKNDINNYFGDDKNDLYLLMSTATENTINKLNNLLKLNNISVKK